jgi:hypothetical protein
MEKGKLRMLEDWYAVRNSILRASDGEMKVTYLRPEDPNEKGVIGIAVDMELKFAKVLPEDFSAKEKKAVEEAIKEIDKKLKE